jgi:hypothetical protein
MEGKVAGMTDHHVHIGQFEEVYYEALAVFDAVFAGGPVRSIHFSSTTSCKPSVRFSEVEQEVYNALSLLPQENTRLNNPWLWFIPAYIKQGIDIDEAMRNISYFGIKLHPYADNWDFENKTHKDALHRIFDSTNRGGNIRILIHTGESDRDSPIRFLPFFTEYPSAHIVLAHGRPANETIQIMRRFPQIACDTAFMPEAEFQKIVKAGFADRIFTGSDFPITHYFATHHREQNISLGEQYQIDCTQMRQYQTIIEEWELETIAAGGNPWTQNLAGDCYANGRGVTQDYNKKSL